MGEIGGDVVEIGGPGALAALVVSVVGKEEVHADMTDRGTSQCSAVLEKRNDTSFGTEREAVFTVEDGEGFGAGLAVHLQEGRGLAGHMLLLRPFAWGSAVGCQV